MVEKKEKKKWKLPEFDGWLFIFCHSVLMSLCITVFSYTESIEVVRIVMWLNLLGACTTALYYRQANRLMGRMIIQVTALQQMLIDVRSAPAPIQEEVESHKQGHHLM